MIKENQKLLNQLHILSDGLAVFLSFPVAFWVRFYVFSGTISVPLPNYLVMAAAYTAAQLFTYAVFGLYRSFRRTRLRVELRRLWEATLLDMLVLQSLLFLSWGIYYSRWVLGVAFLLSAGGLSVKRYILRRILSSFRQKGYNQKHVMVLGGGALARKYLQKVWNDKELGYHPIGYVADRDQKAGLRWLGGFDRLDELLEKYRPDEVVCAVDADDFRRTPEIIAVCEAAGVKLSIIPFYADYMSSNPQFDDLNGLPLLNIRRVPLDNWANAFCKRVLDIVGSALLLIVTSPLLLVCTVGVKLSSPGPVIFRQKRIGLGKKSFYMYKFRSMRMNDAQDTAWSTNEDDRKTAFGAFMRKCSLDELPQFWNVLKGDMSLVGPRPEIPHFVEQFRREIPLYMVKHQVRPGITGWAQVNGYRGDTSIRERIEHDIYYIEHWSLWFDVQILFTTVFGGKFLNDETVVKEKVRR